MNRAAQTPSEQAQLPSDGRHACSGQHRHNKSLPSGARRLPLTVFGRPPFLPTCSEKSFPSTSSLLECPPGLWTSIPWLSRIVASWRKRTNY